MAREQWREKPADAGLRFKLLGDFQAWLDGAPVAEAAFPRRKALSLLKLLALQRDHQIHRDRALDSLWPGLATRSANAQLYKAISHVRQAFSSVDPVVAPDQLIQLRGDILRLDAPGGVRTDVEEFEGLAEQGLQARDARLIQQAVDGYAGDLLPSDRYEPWTATQRDALRGCYVDLLVELGDISLSGGLLGEAESALRLALAQDPARESAHRSLMLVYARQGRRLRALRQFDACVEALRNELGVEASEETTRLHRAIERGHVHEADGERLSTHAFATLPPIAGCREELGEIRRCLQRVGTGRGAVLGLVGDAGIGKTRLAQEILRFGWQRRWHALLGGAHSPEGQLSYQPVIEALRMAVWENPANAELIPPELAAAIPEISPVTSTAKPADRLAAQADLFAGVARFLQTRSRTAPVILVLEDLHDADEGTLRLFHYLARQTAGQPLLLVGTWRPAEPDAPALLAEVVGSLEREGLLNRVHLRTLSASDHRTLLAQMLDGGRLDDDLADALYRLTEGVPLFAREMVAQLVADGQIVRQAGSWQLTGDVDSQVPAIPRSIQALVARRLDALSEPARRLVQLASVIGDEMAVSTIEVASGDAPRFAQLDALDETLAARLLTEGGQRLRFTHRLLRSAIYDAMSGVRQRALHRQAGQALEAQFADNPADLPVTALAHHYVRAGEPDRAIDYLMQAGDKAAAVYDHDRALRCYTEVCSLLEGQAGQEQLLAQAWERAGDIQRAIGNVPESRAAYLNALAVAPQSAVNGSRRVRFDLHRKAVLATVLTADVMTAGEHLSEAKSLLGADPLDEARLLIAEALFDWHCLQTDAAIAHAGRALEIAEQHGAEVEETQACEMLALSHLARGDWQAGLEYELRRGGSSWSPDIVVAVDAHLCLFQYRLSGPEWRQQAQQFMDQVAAQASDLGNLRCLAICQFILGYLAVLRGQPAGAGERFMNALELHQRIGSPSGAAYTLAGLVELLTAGQHYQAAWPLIQQGLVISEQASIRDHCLSQIYAAGIENRLRAGDRTAASELVNAAKQQDALSGPCSVCRPDLYTKFAAFHLAIGETDQARAYVEQALPIVDATQNQPGRARLLRERGQIHALLGEPSEAGRDLLEAASIFRQLDDEYDLARTLEIWTNLPSTPIEDPALRQFDAREVLGRFRVARLPMYAS